MKIFLVEDNDGDVELFKEALDINKLRYDIKVVSDAEQALYVITSIINRKYTPNLIVLDLNIPKGGGLNLLRVLKTNDIIRQIPVIVFSSSTRPEDIKTSYSLFANSYVVKPFELDSLIETINNIYVFWFDTAQLIDT